MLIDEKLKPWVLEVNVMPSLSSSSPMDKRIKSTSISDLFNMVGFVHFNRKKYEKEQGHKRFVLGLWPSVLLSLLVPEGQYSLLISFSFFLLFRLAVVVTVVVFVRQNQSS